MYDPTQPTVERHGYDNLILLCAVHHKVVDSDPGTYSVEWLRKMKLDHEAQATHLPDAEAEAGARMLIDQSVTSVGQSGGITAHVVHINLAEAPPTSSVERQGAADVPPGNSANLRAATFFAGDSYLIDRSSWVDEEGRTSEFLYWQYGPSAWLRVLPATPKDYGRSELQRTAQSAQPALRAFGVSHRTEVFSNVLGSTAVGFDGDLPDTIATRITQVLRSGEIWGLNSVFVERVMTKGIRSFRILWTPMRQDFEATLSHYIQFADDTLKLQPPFTVVAGLAMVRDAEFIRDKSAWFTNPPRTTRCLEDFVSVSCLVADLDGAPSRLLEPFYNAVFDACTLDYSEEPTVHTWPK
jgi:hypothetical protein